MDLDLLLHVSPDVDECGNVERDVHLYVNSSMLNLDDGVEMTLTFDLILVDSRLWMTVDLMFQD